MIPTFLLIQLANHSNARIPYGIQHAKIIKKFPWSNNIYNWKKIEWKWMNIPWTTWITSLSKSHKHYRCLNNMVPYLIIRSRVLAAGIQNHIHIPTKLSSIHIFSNMHKANHALSLKSHKGKKKTHHRLNYNTISRLQFLPYIQLEWFLSFNTITNHTNTRLLSSFIF